jgi:hypothetical protein
MTLCGWCGKKMLGYGARCPECVRREQGTLGAVLVAIALLVGVTLLCGCSSWRQGVTVGLRGASAAADQAETWAVQHCLPVMAQCAGERRTTPATCPELVRCQAERAPVLKVVVTVRAAVLAGVDALLVANAEAKALTWLTAAVRAVQALQSALAPWGVTLPIPALPGGA